MCDPSTELASNAEEVGCLPYCISTLATPVGIAASKVTVELLRLHVSWC